MKQTENEVKKALKEWLEWQGWTVYRINNAGVFRGYNKKGEKRFSFDGDLGVADFFCAKEGFDSFWVETKATDKKPSESQEDFILMVNNSSNGIAFWADSLDMFIGKFNEIHGKGKGNA